VRMGMRCAYVLPRTTRRSCMMLAGPDSLRYLGRCVGWIRFYIIILGRN
jgi:hypothetical protein